MTKEPSTAKRVIRPESCINQFSYKNIDAPDKTPDNDIIDDL